MPLLKNISFNYFQEQLRDFKVFKGFFENIYHKKIEIILSPMKMSP